MRISLGFGEIVLPGILLTGAGIFGQELYRFGKQGDWLTGVSAGMQALKQMPLEYTLGIVFIGVIVFVFAKMDELLATIANNCEKPAIVHLVSGVLRVICMSAYMVIAGWYALGTFDGALSDAVAIVLNAGIVWSLLFFGLDVLMRKVFLEAHYQENELSMLLNNAVPIVGMTCFGVVASFYACCPFLNH